MSKFTIAIQELQSNHENLQSVISLLTPVHAVRLTNICKLINSLKKDLEEDNED